MRLETVPVEVSTRHGHSREGELVLLDGEEERLKLANGKHPPKVLSIDALLKGLVTLLLAILVGISGWLFNRVISNSERLTTIEAHVNEHTRQNTQILSELHQVQSLLREVLQHDSKLAAEMEFLKEEVRKR